MRFSSPILVGSVLLVFSIACSHEDTLDDIEDEIDDKCDEQRSCIRWVENIVEPAAEIEPVDTLEILEDWDVDDGLEELADDLIDMLED